MPATRPTAPIVAHTHQATARRENGAAGDDGLLSGVTGGAWFIWVDGACVVGATGVVGGGVVVGAAGVGDGVKNIPQIVTPLISLVGRAGGGKPTVGMHLPTAEIWSAPLQQSSCVVEMQVAVNELTTGVAGFWYS